ncbi:MAG TPA: hypothetical protein VI028_03720, partial [Solirubrobacterales bacterium]
ARHTYASLMIAAGVNAKALCEFMGHSSIQVTLDLYGHLMPGAESEAASRLDALLANAESQARGGAYQMSTTHQPSQAASSVSEQFSESQPEQSQTDPFAGDLAR